MLKKKVCMLGTLGVGKTSLVRRFVSDTFEDKYLTTIGVKIEQREVVLDNGSITLVLWDLHGDDEFKRLQASYLRGSAACMLVADGTRKDSVDSLIELEQRIFSLVGKLPCIALLNKSDLRDKWDKGLLETLKTSTSALGCFASSACSGEGVESSFKLLAEKLL